MDAVCWQAPPATPTAAVSQGTGQASAFTAGGSGTGQQQQQQQSYAGTQGRAYAHMRALRYMSRLLLPLIGLANQHLPLGRYAAHRTGHELLIVPCIPSGTEDIRLLALVSMCSSKPSS